MSLADRISDLLSKNRPMKACKIADLLRAEKKEVNQVLYAGTDRFIKDIFFNWRLK